MSGAGNRAPAADAPPRSDAGHPASAITPQQAMATQTDVIDARRAREKAGATPQARDDASGPVKTSMKPYWIGALIVAIIAAAILI